MFLGATQKLASQLNRLTVFGNVMNCCPHFVLKVLVKRYVRMFLGEHRNLPHNSIVLKI